MKYFFQPGRLPELAFAELVAVLSTEIRKTDINGSEKLYSIEKSIEKTKSYVHLITSNIVIVDGKYFPDVDMRVVFKRLGGFIRFGELIEDEERFFQDYYDTKKIVFGVSHIVNPEDLKIKAENSIHREATKNKFQRRSKAEKAAIKMQNAAVETSEPIEINVKDFARKIKEMFTAKEVSTRFVLPLDDDRELNAAQIINNELIEKGFELVIFSVRDRVLSGKTHAIQDINEFAQRDYGRPYTDKQMGTLPPKLARIMVNLSFTQPQGTIWDPFCGSGTVLQEGLLGGINVMGSDIDKNALYFSNENIKWLIGKYNLEGMKYRVFEMDIRAPEKPTFNQLKKTEIDAVICEPYMGPHLSRTINAKKAETLSKVVLEQYEALFKMLEFLGKKGLVVVVVVPAYKTYQGWASVRINTVLSKRWRNIGKMLGRDLHWKRANSIIRREILIFSRER